MSTMTNTAEYITGAQAYGTDEWHAEVRSYATGQDPFADDTPYQIVETIELVENLPGQPPRTLGYDRAYSEIERIGAERGIRLVEREWPPAPGTSEQEAAAEAAARKIYEQWKRQDQAAEDGLL